MSNTRLEKTLSAWPAWPVENQPRVIKTFTDGLNHEVYLLQDGSRQLVLKLFDHAHKSAIETQQWAAELSLAPSILYASKINDYALMALIEQPSIKPLDITTQQLITLATSLRTLHNADYSEIAETTGKFDLLGFCHQYLVQLELNIQQFPSHKDWSTYQAILAMHAALTPALDIFNQDKFPPALCHNDLVAANCFVTEAGARFIDWEYAQVHNPWFDLASIITYLKLSDSDAFLFLESYQTGLGSKTNSAIFYASQCALLWGDILWHLAKFGIGFKPKLKEKLASLNRLASGLKIDLAN